MSGMETHSWVYGIIPTVTSREYWECNLTHCYPKVGILTFFPVYRNDVCPVMCSFSEIVQLTSFCIYRSMRINNSKYLWHVWFAEK